MLALGSREEIQEGFEPYLNGYDSKQKAFEVIKLLDAKATQEQVFTVFEYLVDLGQSSEFILDFAAGNLGEQISLIPSNTTAICEFPLVVQGRKRDNNHPSLFFATNYKYSVNDFAFGTIMGLNAAYPVGIVLYGFYEDYIRRLFGVDVTIFNFSKLTLDLKTDFRSFMGQLALARIPEKVAKATKLAVPGPSNHLTTAAYTDIVLNSEKLDSILRVTSSLIPKQLGFFNVKYVSDKFGWDMVWHKILNLHYLPE